ncbi:MAG: cytochrome c3 family protein [Desulfobacteraceae bacterium]|nr:cytochrome c3 family protein [Desulfobacteraceae bacterium]MBC2720289.1 cytochrome c3 family protein [Desulfobacteraceae bacterium]
MKRKKILLWCSVFVMTLFLCGVGTGNAVVTGECFNCHTMHNSQNGSYYLTGPHEHLLLSADGCVGCHSSSSSSTTYTLGSSTVPVVNFTGGIEPSAYLSGGNFYWVAQGGAANDPKGHNVFGIASQDSLIAAGVGAPGDSNGSGCGPGSCHATLAIDTVTTGTYLAPNGCQGCHLDVQHHTDDTGGANGPNSKYVGSSPWYRFLVGHQSGPPDGTYGVEGIEHNSWGPSDVSPGSDHHNEYKGETGEGSGTLVLGFGTMTAFCSGCHGDFHEQQDTGTAGQWTRHPSDLTIPVTGEYASINDYNFDTLTPVARTDAAITTLSGTSSGTVSAGSDMVMCLSCHRPHGSKNDDLLRWNYDDMVAGSAGALENRGCFYCHSTKDD